MQCPSSEPESLGSGSPPNPSHTQAGWGSHAGAESGCSFSYQAPVSSGRWPGLALLCLAFALGWGRPSHSPSSHCADLELGLQRAEATLSRRGACWALRPSATAWQPRPGLREAARFPVLSLHWYHPPPFSPTVDWLNASV